MRCRSAAYPPNGNAHVRPAPARPGIPLPVWTNPGQMPFVYDTVLEKTLNWDVEFKGEPQFVQSPYGNVPRKVYHPGPYEPLCANEKQDEDDIADVSTEPSKHESPPARRRLYKFNYKDACPGQRNDAVISSSYVDRAREQEAEQMYMDIQPAFDWHMVKSAIRPSNLTQSFDYQLQEKCLERLKEITPTEATLCKQLTMCSNLSTVLNKLKNPDASDAFAIYSVDQVGPHRMGTTLEDEFSVDFVVTLRTLPARASLQTLANRIQEDMRKLKSSYTVTQRELNFEIVNVYDPKETAQLFIATIPELLKDNTNIAINKCLIEAHTRAVAEARWFTEISIAIAHLPNLIRLFSDIVRRFADLQSLTPFMITVLCHYGVTQQEIESPKCPSAPVPLGEALRRLFQLLAAGLFLPYSTGITDPIDPQFSIHSKLTTKAQETITRTAQTLLRVLVKEGGIDYVLGLNPQLGEKVLTEESDWHGQKVVPSVSIFERELSIDLWCNSNRDDCR